MRIRIPFRRAMIDYRKTIEECKYLIRKGDFDKKPTHKKYYVKAYNILLRFENDHPMYIRKIAKMRNSLEDRLRWD